MMQKIWSVIRWVFIAVILQIIIIPLSYIIFPISYLLRDKLRAIMQGRCLFYKTFAFPLWVFLDDMEYYVQGHDYGEPWWRKAKGLSLDTKWQRFKAAYLWGVVRNPAWNQYEVIKPKQGDKNIIKYNGHLTRNGEEVGIEEFATLKWIDEEGNYSDNKGKYLSSKYSTFGKMFLWYKIKGTLYWRYSFANKVRNRWIEVHLGTTDLRYTIRFKIKKGEKI